MKILGYLLLLSLPVWAQRGAAPHPAGMRAGWGITVADEDVLKLAVQLGVRDIVIYGGPGARTLPGTATPLSKPRADY